MSDVSLSTSVVNIFEHWAVFNFELVCSVLPAGSASDSVVYWWCPTEFERRRPAVQLPAGVSKSGFSENSVVSLAAVPTCVVDVSERSVVMKNDSVRLMSIVASAHGSVAQ